MTRHLLIVLLAIVLGGCGQHISAPTAPAPSASSRVGVPSQKPAVASLPDEDPGAPPPEGGEGLPSFYSVWDGGPHSLPYNGTTSWQDVVQHALSMNAVQLAMNEFSTRGYVRRADRDTARSVPGGSLAVIMYEKPGQVDKCPFVMVASEAMYLASCGGWVPSTQVLGGVLTDSCGYFVYRETPGDEAVGVRSALVMPLSFAANPEGVPCDTTVVTTNGILTPCMPQCPPDVDPFLYGGRSCREYGPQTYEVAMRELAEEKYFSELMLVSIIGGISGGARGWSSGPLGMVSGALWVSGTAAASYMATHPYPPRP
jgi:hypothetical protein